MRKRTREREKAKMVETEGDGERLRQVTCLTFMHTGSVVGEKEGAIAARGPGKKCA